MAYQVTPIAKSELGQFRAMDFYGDSQEFNEISYQDSVSHYEESAQIQYLLGQLSDARIAAQGDPQSLQELDEAYREITALKFHSMSPRQIAAIAAHIRAATDEIKSHAVANSSNHSKALSAAQKYGVLSSFAAADYMKSAFVTAGKITDLSGFARQFGFMDQLPIMEKLNRLFEHDIAIVNNPNIQALTATLAKIDNEVFKAQLKAKNAADMIANNASGLLRNFSDASKLAQTKMLSQLEDIEQSELLTSDDKEAIAQMTKILRETGTDRLKNLIQAAREGKTFNDIGVLKQYLVIDVEKNEAKIVTMIETPLRNLPSQNPDGALSNVLKESRAAAAAAREAGVSGGQSVAANDNTPIMGIVVTKTVSGRAAGRV